MARYLVHNHEVTSNDRVVLEELVDAYGLKGVLECMVGICYDKADHVRASYAGETAAKSWEALARIVDTASRRT